MLSYAIKAKNLLLFSTMLTLVMSSHPMQDTSLTKTFSSLLKNHPMSAGIATTLGVGGIFSYCYRNYLINFYKQALLQQQKGALEIKIYPAEAYILFLVA